MQFKAAPGNNASLTIAYGSPRSGLSALGIRTGTVLFEGTRQSDNIRGKAMTFSRNCDPQPYDVAGEFVSPNRIVLRGQRPLRNSRCQTTGSVSERLEFSLMPR